MPRISDAHRAAQRQRILDAAIAVATEKGLANVSMSNVIETSGLSAGAIYGYFDSKDAILREAAADIVAGRTALFTEATVQGRSPGEVMHQLMTWVPGVFRSPGLIVEVWAEAPHQPGLMQVAMTSARQLTDAFAAYLIDWFVRARGMDAEAASERARRSIPALMGLVQGCFVSTHLGLADADAYADSVDALLGEF